MCGFHNNHIKWAMPSKNLRNNFLTSRSQNFWIKPDYRLNLHCKNRLASGSMRSNGKLIDEAATRKLASRSCKKLGSTSSSSSRSNHSHVGSRLLASVTLPKDKALLSLAKPSAFKRRTCRVFCKPSLIRSWLSWVWKPFHLRLALAPVAQV